MSLRDTNFYQELFKITTSYTVVLPHTSSHAMRCVASTTMLSSTAPNLIKLNAVKKLSFIEKGNSFQKAQSFPKLTLVYFLQQC